MLPKSRLNDLGGERGKKRRRKREEKRQTWLDIPPSFSPRRDHGEGSIPDSSSALRKRNKGGLAMSPMNSKNKDFPGSARFMVLGAKSG